MLQAERSGHRRPPSRGDATRYFHPIINSHLHKPASQNILPRTRPLNCLDLSPRHLVNPKCIDGFLYHIAACDWDESQKVKIG